MFVLNKRIKVSQKRSTLFTAKPSRGTCLIVVLTHHVHGDLGPVLLHRRVGLPRIFRRDEYVYAVIEEVEPEFAKFKRCFMVFYSRVFFLGGAGVFFFCFDIMFGFY